MEPEATIPPRRRHCLDCTRPSAVCLCHDLPYPPISTTAQVVILQHPHEARHKLSTVPVLSKCLRNSTTLVGRRLRPGLCPLLDSRPRAIYLFPSTASSPAVRLNDLKSHHVIFEGKNSDLDENSSFDQCKTIFFSEKLNGLDETLDFELVDDCKTETFSGKISNSYGNLSRRVGSELSSSTFPRKSNEPDENSSFELVDQCNTEVFSGKSSDRDENSCCRLVDECKTEILSGKSHDRDENSSFQLVDECKTETLSEKSLDRDGNSGSRLVNECKMEVFTGLSLKQEENSGSRWVDQCKEDIFMGKLSEPLVLIVFDATWKHAKEMVAASEDFLSSFATRVCLDTDESVEGASIYDSELVLRKEPFGGCVSTMEAVARCLRVIELNGEEIEGKLIGVLREMVRLQAGFLKAMKPRVKLGKKGKEREKKKTEGV